MCDMIDIFADINSEVVKQYEERIKRGSRKGYVSKIFRDVTQCLVTIERLLKEIKITPINGP